MDRVTGVVLGLMAALFLSCAVASVAERRADGSLVIDYLAQGAESIVSERRADAMLKAKQACEGKEFAIEKEWDSAADRTGFGVENRRSLLVRCIDAGARDASVLARVTAETGCSTPVVEGVADVGSSRVYRVLACGPRVVCDVVGLEVKCKRALSEAP